MGARTRILNPVVAACVVFFSMQPALAYDQSAQAELTALLEELRDPGQQRWQRIERQINRIWSRSGSSSADLLLQRGRSAMRRGDSKAAIDHFSALIDHAPDFAEGWHGRATAYFMEKRLGHALADLQETLARNPNHFAALAGTGRIFEDLQNFEAALAAFRASAAIHPHRADVQAALERVERQLQGISL